MPTPTSWSQTEYSTLTGFESLDALLFGYEWVSHTISYSFPTTVGSWWSTDTYTGYGPSTGDQKPWSEDFSGLFTEDKVAVQTALASWANVANINFIEVADNETIVGDIRLAYSNIGEAQASTYYPGNSSCAGDIWFNTNGTSYTAPWVQGSYSYMAVVHELGHALGLKHPFEGSIYNATLIDPIFDSRSYTIMSYSAQPGDEGTKFSFEPTTPMILDILAIQQLYGANYSFNSNNTVYDFSEFESYHKTIWDGGGIDTFRYNSSTDGAIDLRAGFLNGSRLGNSIYIEDKVSGNHLSQVNNIWIAYGTVIENAIGGTGNDIINGNLISNILWGEAGNDQLNGDAGDDQLVAGDGDDLLLGDDGNDIMWGEVGNDALNGGVGADTMIGGLGNDTYYVDDAGDIVIENVDEGIDTVQAGITYTLAADIENLTLTGATAINGTGNSLNNSLTGTSAANILNGGTGIDILAGGLGGDSYVVDNTGDIVSENLDEGTDSIQSSVTLILAANVENLILTGAAAINGTGNALANALYGNAAANILNGGVGADTMLGGLGNDTYLVDNLGDATTETNTLVTEIDTVFSSVTRILGANLERLYLSGTAAINGTGNALANTLVGNAAANVLNGGTGIDTMIGGLGNDTYYVDNLVDITTETNTLSTEIDTVISSVTRTLGDNLEKLTLSGSSAINGYGNALANTLVGNAAANILNGGTNIDSMTGGAGNDTYYVDNTGDTTTETGILATEIDTVISSITRTLGNNLEKLTLSGTAAINGTGNALANTLVGNAAANILNGGTGNDVLFGGTGNDFLIGGAGSDTFVFDSILNATTNKDSITDFNAVEDTIRLDCTIFTRLTTGALDAGLFRSSASSVAADSNDYILYNTTSGALLYDQDANGAGIAVQFATLTTKPAITSVDFMVVA